MTKTISKTSKRAQAILEGARNIRVYSINNSFAGKPLSEHPAIWKPDQTGRSHMIAVSQAEFLRNELRWHGTKLRDDGYGHYIIDVHSNLWYTFESEGDK